MSCPDVTVMFGMAYLLTYLLYRIGLVGFLYSPIPQAGTLAPVGFPATGYEDTSVGRNVFTCDSPSLPKEAGIAQWLERRTRDRKVAGSNPCWSGGRIFFSRVNFLC